jgi:Protein of unknown function (DUF3352)
MTEPRQPDTDPGLDTTVTPVPPIGEPSVPAPTASPVAPLTPAAAHEPATAIPTAPIGGEPATNAPRRSRVRWVAALVIIALVVTASAAAALLLTAGSPGATVLGYVPSDSVMYGEVRLDLPGDQKQAVGSFLSKFPGFADQAALDTKLDEVLDRLVADASGDQQTFTADIKPWFDGEIAFAVGPLPDAAALTDPESAAADSRAMVLISVKDATLAQSWFDDLMSTSGVTGTPQTYEGVELTVFSEPSMPGAQAAFGIVGGDVAIVGDLASVQAAIDTKGTSGLAGDPAFSAAADAIDADHIGFVYVELGTLMDRAMAVAEGQATSQLPAALSGAIPGWVAAGLRIESDAVVMDAVLPHQADAIGPDSNHVNGVADWAPPTTVLMAAGNDYGATLDEMITRLRSVPEASDAFDGIDQATGILGGLDAVIGWIGDAGLVISQDGTDLEGGIVIIPTDADAANQLMTTIRTFATLGGATQGITVRDEDHNGTTITIVDLGSAQDLVGMAGALGGADLPADPGSLPLPDGNVELSYAVTDGVVVIGSGPDFVKSVLDAGAGTSLADEARYSGLVSRVGAEGTGVTFVDIAAMRGIFEGLMASASDADRAEYEGSVKPFLTPFDAFVAASSVGSEVDSQRAIITVK